ncbi:hypothetical protein Taro_053565 [Colocasia esculenta]|uniref:Uncharacterized protein n=1 Tax=Colocasia esculenta TaxID=4460 RepID=A0A843XLI9_COLES|nr:hypothetical protein [Colocasia esculenta]
MSSKKIVTVTYEIVTTDGSSVDTATGCVDTLSQSGNWVFWRLGLLETGSSVDITGDCVDTLDPIFMKLLQGMIPSVDTINGCVDTTMIRIVCP